MPPAGIKIDAGGKKVYAENKGIINFLLDNPREIDYHGKTKVQTKNSILLVSIIVKEGSLINLLLVS